MIVLADLTAEMPKQVPGWVLYVAIIIILVLGGILLRIAKGVVDKVLRDVAGLQAAFHDLREAITKEVAPLRTDVALLKGIAVGTDRRQKALEAGTIAKLRADDEVALEAWGKP